MYQGKDMKLNSTAEGQGLIHGEALYGPANDRNVDGRLDVPDKRVRSHLGRTKKNRPKAKRQNGVFVMGDRCLC
jgi:hypothetical protein